jgi:diguanylate cyclase (GGDEF)-like protein
LAGFLCRIDNPDLLALVMEGPRTRAGQPAPDSSVEACCRERSLAKYDDLSPAARRPMEHENVISRVFGPLFGPAAALIGRLRYAQKFVVVGLVLLIPLGFVATAYVGLQRDQIAFSAKERSGVTYMAPLVELTARVAQGRHAAVTAQGGGGVNIDEDIAAVDAVERRLGSLLGTAQAWPAARRLVVAAQHATGSVSGRYVSYNAAMEALLNLIVHVGDESNLTLDPDLDTYYLMDTLQFRLPVLLDTAGRSADLALLATAQPADAKTDALIELGLTNGVLTTTRSTIARAVGTITAKTANAVVRHGTNANFRRLDDATAALTATLTAAVKDRQPSRVRPDASDAVRAAAGDFAAQAATSLDRLLQARIDGFSARAYRVEIAAGLAALLGAYLFVGFYLSVAPPIRRIVDTLHAVAAGDLTRRVSVDTHDELSFVARALNDTVTKTEIATNRLARQATHDTLTGLPNRALVLNRLELALESSRHTGALLAVLFIDLDRFKPINDSLGHHTGDEVLTVIAGRLIALLRDVDTVARLGGDEFMVLCERLAFPAAAVGIGEMVVAELSRPIKTGGGSAAREVTVGASVGVAYADAGTELTPEDLVRDADVAMYQAKQRGRGRVEVFDDVLRIAVERRLQTEDDLRHAIDRGEIRTYYQPIVDGTTAAVLGFEALARWQHPTGGLLGPGDFIEVAEESGLIVPLGAEILTQACAQAVRWREDHPGHAHLHVAVNVASAQLAHRSFVPTIEAVLAETGLDPDALWLEITETTIMADTEAAAETLRAIRALGVHLAIDDFGTGYSSLTYLRRFPVETLKIDRSFVAGIGRDREDEVIVDMILSLARALDLRVVAEGVETAEQLEQLRHLGCGLMQGFYFSRPMPVDQVRSYLSQSQPVLS